MRPCIECSTIIHIHPLLIHYPHLCNLCNLCISMYPLFYSSLSFDCGPIARQCCDVLWGKWNSQCPRITCGWFPTPYDKKWPHSLVARLHQRLKRFPAVNSIHCHQIFWWYLVMIWVMSNKDIICYFWYTIFRIGNDWKMEMIGFPFLDAWWGGFICHWFADSSR